MGTLAHTLKRFFHQMTGWVNVGHLLRAFSLSGAVLDWAGCWLLAASFLSAEVWVYGPDLVKARDQDHCHQPLILSVFRLWVG